MKSEGQLKQIQEDKSVIDTNEKIDRTYGKGDISPHNAKIAMIFEQRKGYLIYLTENGILAWNIDKEALNEKRLFAVTECRRLQSLVETKIPKGYFEKAEKMLGYALANAMSEPSKKALLSHFSEARRFIDLYSIKSTLSEGDDFEIYITKDDKVYFWHKQPQKFTLAIVQFQTLRDLADSLLPKSYRKNVSNMLATALRSAFRSNPEEDWLTHFQNVKDFITNMSLVHARSKYLISSFLIGFVIIITMVFLHLSTNLYLPKLFTTLPSEVVNDLRNIILGGIGGAVGAIISILQRSWNIELDPKIPTRSLAFQAGTRIVLGLLFGGIIVIAAKSNLALGFIDKNIYSMLIFAIISGFSERFVPDLMEKIAKKEIKAEEEKKEIKIN